MKNNDKLTYTVSKMAKVLDIVKNRAYEFVRRISGDIYRLKQQNSL